MTKEHILTVEIVETVTVQVTIWTETVIGAQQLLDEADGMILKDPDVDLPEGFMDWAMLSQSVEKRTIEAFTNPGTVGE
jgi:hypothetical protein